MKVASAQVGLTVSIGVTLRIPVGWNNFAGANTDGEVLGGHVAQAFLLHKQRVHGVSLQLLHF